MSSETNATQQVVTPQKKPMGTGVKVLLGCVSVIVVLSICGIAFTVMTAAGVSKVANDVSTQQKADDAKKEEAFNSPKKLGELVTVKDVQWTLLEAKNLGNSLPNTYGYGSGCVANSGTFVQIKVKIKNNSSKMVTISSLTLLDDKKREFVSSSDVYSCVNSKDLFVIENVNPGIENTFSNVYEIPSDSTGLRLKVGDTDLFTNEFNYISLGL